MIAGNAAALSIPRGAAREKRKQSDETTACQQSQALDAAASFGRQQPKQNCYSGNARRSERAAKRKPFVIARHIHFSRLIFTYVMLSSGVAITTRLPLYASAIPAYEYFILLI
jgi:hypothetical protein